MVSFCRADAQKLLQRWGVSYKISNARSREVLGIQYREAETSLKDMVESMIDIGLTEDKRTQK